MGRYRRIDTRIHNDENFRALSDDGKLLFFTLLTHQHMTSVGAMRATIAGLAAEQGWRVPKYRKAFREAFAKGMVEVDEKACYVGLPNFLKYNPPESPNVVKSWAGILDLIPECALKVALYQRVKALAEGLGEAFREALPEAMRKASRIPEPIPMPIPEPIPDKDSDAIAEVAKEFVAAWNALGKPFSKIIVWGPDRQKLLTLRLKNDWWREHWREGLERMKASPFCRGETDRGTWIADVEFFLRPNSLTKILEGKYDHREPVPQESPSARFAREYSARKAQERAAK